MTGGSRRRRASAEERTARLRTALVALVDGDLDAAEAELQQLVQSLSTHETSVAAYRVLATLFRERGEVGRSIRIHQNLLLSQKLSRPDRAAVQRGLARDFQAGGFRDRAIEAWREALKLEASSAEALEALLDLEIEAGETAAARATLKRLVRARREPEPGDALRAQVLADLEAEKGAARSARRLFGQAIRLDPDSADYYYEQLGRFEAGLGRRRAAAKALREALDRHPHALGRRRLFGALAELHAEGGKRERTKFRRLLEQCLERDAQDVAAREALGRLRVEEGDRDGGLGLLREAVASQSDDPGAHVALGRALLEAADAPEGDAKPALEAYRALLDALSPEGPEEATRTDAEAPEEAAR